MKNLFLLVMIIISSLTIDAQNVIDKAFETQISSTCVETSEYMYMIYFYRRLHFKKDTVAIVDFKIGTDAESQQETKSYQWKIIDSVITIDGYNAYKKIIVKGDTIVCTNYYNNKFKEVINPMIPR